MDGGACTSDDILSFDERQHYEVFPKPDPRVRTLIQEVTGEGEHEPFLLTQTAARVFATKEVARGMANPTPSDMRKLKRLARYIYAHPRVALVLSPGPLQEGVCFQ